MDEPVVPPSSYTPKVAVVTGGAQGIGYAICQKLAEDGIDIAINDLPSKKELAEEVAAGIRKKGRRAIVVHGDVTTEADVKAMIEKTAQELGSVDIVRTVRFYVPTEFVTQFRWLLMRASHHPIF